MDQVAQVREKIDIVSLISEYLSVKKTGRNFTALCPFHGEKTPSFVISPERQIWHCFGCNRGGDCFSFLIQYENLEFPEALRILAQKSGVVLENQQFEKGKSEKELIYTLNRISSEFYSFVLTQHMAGKRALDYLTRKRGINEKVIKTFGLGFAPYGNALVKYLMQKKKFKKEEIITAGLATYKGNLLSDFFMNRLMFPLKDHRGNIIGFSGRILDDSLMTSKYINTRETLVYHKGSVFFALDIAKEAIKKENKAIIMEGEFDVISSFQNGVGNVVAVKGTALTENQANLISRFTQNVSLCFDSDSSGQEALKRSIAILEKRGINISAIVFDNAKDADEAIKKDFASFIKVIKTPVGIYDFLFSKAISLFDKNSAEGKRKIGNELLPFFSGIENEIVKEHFLKKLAKELDISFESLIKQIEKNKKKSDIYEEARVSFKNKKRDEILENYLISLLIQSKETKSILEKEKELFKNLTFNNMALKRILQTLFLYFRNEDKIDSKKFLSDLPSELISVFDTCYLFPLPKFPREEEYVEEIKKVARELRIIYLREKIKEITNKIKEKEKIKEENNLTILQQEFVRLTSLLSES